LSARGNEEVDFPPVGTGTPSEDGEAMSEGPKVASIIDGYPSAVNLSWFAVYTATHHEKRVFEQLRNHEVETFLPLYKTSRKWNKRTPVTVELPLFPNYVFVRIQRDQRSVVLGTQGVFSIVGSGKQAWELPHREIEALRTGIHERKVEPYEYLTIGERARVVCGVLAGLEGVIVRKRNNLHIVLNLDQIMKSVAIEVDASELEPVKNRPSSVTGTALPSTAHCRTTPHRKAS
jgi:transcriptional antiterminator RfaH